MEFTTNKLRKNTFNIVNSRQINSIKNFNKKYYYLVGKNFHFIRNCPSLRNNNTNIKNLTKEADISYIQILKNSKNFHNNPLLSLYNKKSSKSN